MPIVIVVVPALLQYSGHWLQKASSTAIWTGPAAAALIVVFFVSLRLDTRLDAAGIHYRLTPLQLKWQHRPWTEVSHAYIRTYDPLTEYGGWGIKGVAANRAYNVAGAEGLQLVLTNGKRLLIGTQHPDEIRYFIAQMAVAGEEGA